MIESIIAGVTAIIIVLVICRTTLLALAAQTRLEEVKLKERDEEEWDALRADVEKWKQDIRDVRSKLSIRGMG